MLVLSGLLFFDIICKKLSSLAVFVGHSSITRPSIQASVVSGNVAGVEKPACVHVCLFGLGAYGQNKNKNKTHWRMKELKVTVGSQKKKSQRLTVHSSLPAEEKPSNMH